MHILIALLLLALPARSTADLLPESYRGIYGSPRTGGTPAQEIARSLACIS